jgi:hypothetical protein
MTRSTIASAKITPHDDQKSEETKNQQDESGPSIPRGPWFSSVGLVVPRCNGSVFPWLHIFIPQVEALSYNFVYMHVHSEYLFRNMSRLSIEDNDPLLRLQENQAYESKEDTFFSI